MRSWFETVSAAIHAAVGALEMIKVERRRRADEEARKTEIEVREALQDAQEQLREEKDEIRR